MPGLIPSKVQWNRWSLPAKASYIGVPIGILALIIGVGPCLLPASSTAHLEKKIDQLPSTVLQEIQKTINAMDTNRVHAEFLEKEVVQLRAQGEAYKSTLFQKQAELASAVAQITTLSNQLAALTPLERLPPSDFARVTNALAAARHVTSVLRGKARVSGRVAFH